MQSLEYRNDLVTLNCIWRARETEKVRTFTVRAGEACAAPLYACIAHVHT